jgi:guanyl-specific ribonuclease Sa
LNATLIVGLCLGALTLWQKSLAPSPAPAQPSAASEAAERAPRSASPRSSELPRKQSVDGVRIVDQHGEVVVRGQVDLRPTLERIVRGEHYPHRNDGAVFQNRPPPGKREPELPVRPRGYYHEYVLPTAGLEGPGPQRIVRGRGGEWYYTPDHYETFIRLD